MSATKRKNHQSASVVKQPTNLLHKTGQLPNLGEKQLLVQFAHLHFSSQVDKSLLGVSMRWSITTANIDGLRICRSDGC